MEKDMLYIASDHAGFALKEKIKEFLAGENLEGEDLGAFSYDPEDDYPDFIIPLAQRVAQENARGIILGGSGQGEAMAANRVRGVRAAVYYGGPLDIVRLSRQDNDSNVLSLGARFLDEEQAFAAIDTWLNTEFEGGRHTDRVQKLDQL